ncbi:MAG: response regulator transcription factor [Alistipes sp.]|nr:response regulator transcription factor [Alistipes sp.]
MKILIVEDEPSLRELMCRELQRENHVVESAASFREADGKLAAYSYDLILLDIMLPDGSGLKLLEKIKAEHRREQVIIISARDSIEDKVEGLELGADDYLPKPFHLMELSARIRSVARRNRGGERGITLGNVTLDLEQQRVVVAGVPLQLLKKEFNILSYFMQRPNHVVDKTLLAEAVWGDHVDQLDSFHFVYGQIKNLRRKLQEADADIEIKAVYGFGYQLLTPEKNR